MFSTSKTSKREYLAKTLAIIISIYKKNKLYMQIGNYLKLIKLTIIFIIYYYNKQLEYLFQLTK